MTLDLRRLGLLSIAAVACVTDSAADSARSIDRCPVQGCGSNTPVLSGSRSIESLNLDGLPDAKGTRYVPGSLRCPGLPELSLDLGIRDGALRGVQPGRPVEERGRCEGAALLQASFVIEVTLDSRPQMIPRRVQTEIRITGLGWVSTWHKNPSSRQLLPTYQLEWKDGAVWKPFCPMKVAWMEPWQVTGNAPSVLGDGWRAATNHAVILHGEAYTPDATVDRGRYGPRWFSIGCAGAAFSKMRLLGYDPMADPLPPPAYPSSQQRARAATLKMITARYRDDPHTVPGMPLHWISMRGVEYFGSPDPRELGPLEALWNHQGASCLSHARLWRSGHAPSGTSESASVAAWAASRCPAAASTLAAPGGWRGAPAEIEWATVTVDHVRHGP